MAAFTNELYSLLISLRDDRIILPHSCIAEVVRNSLPDDQRADGEWLRGTVDWRDREVPVVCFESLLGREAARPGGRTRIVILNTLGDHADDCPSYGILAQGFPQMVRVNREMLKLDDAYTPPPDVPVICQVSILSERALIPDLEMLEERLVTALA